MIRTPDDELQRALVEIDRITHEFKLLESERNRLTHQLKEKRIDNLINIAYAFLIGMFTTAALVVVAKLAGHLQFL